MATQEEVDRGRDAENLLNSAVYTDAWTAVRDGLIRDWARTEPDDVASRERIWISITLLERLQGQLRVTANAGDLASHEFDQNRTTRYQI